MRRGTIPILDRLQLVAGKYLIYPANFWKHKNHEMLLTAFGHRPHAAGWPTISVWSAPARRVRDNNG